MKQKTKPIVTFRIALLSKSRKKIKRLNASPLKLIHFNMSKALSASKGLVAADPKLAKKKDRLVVIRETRDTPLKQAGLVTNPKK